MGSIWVNTILFTLAFISLPGPEHHVAAVVRAALPPRPPRAPQGHQERQRPRGARRREKGRQGGRPLFPGTTIWERVSSSHRSSSSGLVMHGGRVEIKIARSLLCLLF